MATGLSAYVGFTSFTVGEGETVTLELAHGVNAAEFAAEYGVTVVAVSQTPEGPTATFGGTAGALGRMVNEFWN
jgi:hypothetical protein